MKVHSILLVMVAVLLCCLTPGAQRPAEPLPAVDELTPVVFVPGVTGTKLRDPKSGEQVWGGSKQLFQPRDGGYRLVLPLALGESRSSSSDSAHPQVDYEAVEPLLQLRVPGWTKEIYGPLIEYFKTAGYLYGDLAAAEADEDFFFFNYDWRTVNLDSVRRLDRQLEALSEARGGLEVDLVCQSNAAKICRWLTKYGALDADRAEAGEAWQRSYRIRKLVLVGASNSGALRVLQLLDQGRSYVPVFGRRLHPETFFAIRPLFEDLPVDRNDLFFDEQGHTLAVDLFEARNWEKYGWSIFGPEATERLNREPRPDLFGDRQEQLDYLQEQLEHARRVQGLLAQNSAHFPAVRLYLFENTSSPTIDRALLTRVRGEWRTYFLGDRRVDHDPALKRLASAPGDGHAALTSQRGLSPQETNALAATATATGGHFAAVIHAETLDAILGFLAEPSEADK